MTEERVTVNFEVTRLLAPAGEMVMPLRGDEQFREILAAAQQRMMDAWLFDFATTSEIRIDYGIETSNNADGGFAIPADVYRAIADLAGIKNGEAAKRAEKLLREWLSPTQLEQFDREDAFEVTGSYTGRKYRITRGATFNVFYKREETGRWRSMCFRPDGYLEVGDIMLAQKIALETNEGSALAVANHEPDGGYGDRGCDCDLCRGTQEIAIPALGNPGEFTLTVDSTAPISRGMAVSGHNIAAGTIVVSIDGLTHVTLSRAHIGLVSTIVSFAAPARRFGFDLTELDWGGLRPPFPSPRLEISVKEAWHELRIEPLAPEPVPPNSWMARWGDMGRDHLADRRAPRDARSRSRQARRRR